MKLLNKLLPKKQLNVKETIEAIHREFNSASDEIVKKKEYEFTQEEKELFQRASQMATLGFTRLDWVRDTLNKKYEKDTNEIDYENYSYYKQHYPLNKFITESQVEKVCKKYNLLKASASSFIGSIPQKNLQEILDFKLREEDIPYVRSWCGGRIGEVNSNCISKEAYEAESKQGHDHYSYSRDTQMEICAPKNQLETERGRVVGHRLIPDPVVLKPVLGGYLIVTAWGDEAAASNVINEKKN